MKKDRLPFIAATICMMCLFMAMIGCDDILIFTITTVETTSSEEPARLLGTIPRYGGEMPANGTLQIQFNKPVSEVKVNGKIANLAKENTIATWRDEELQLGVLTLTIEWSDEEGNTSTEDIILTITEID